MATMPGSWARWLRFCASCNNTPPHSRAHSAHGRPLDKRPCRPGASLPPAGSLVVRPCAPVRPRAQAPMLPRVRAPANPCVRALSQPRIAALRHHVVAASHRHVVAASQRHIVTSPYRRHITSSDASRIPRHSPPAQAGTCSARSTRENARTRTSSCAGSDPPTRPPSWSRPPPHAR